MIQDINLEGPAAYVEFNDELYFAKNTLETNGGLWRSDGTVSGTTLVADLFISPVSGYLGYYSFGDNKTLAATDNQLFFIGAEEPGSIFGSGLQLWVTDGSVGGEQVLTDFDNGFLYPSLIGGMTAVDDQVFFTAYNSHGNELWVSDGTVSGTSMVVDLSPGGTYFPPPWYFGFPNSTYFGEFVSFDGLLFFNANNELWKSDGTEAGTVRLSDGVGPQELTVVDDTLFFTAENSTNGRELWKSDGTSAGTQPVKDILPGSDSSFQTAGDLTAVGNTLYFHTDDGVHGNELWSSDGTSAGTVLVKDVVSGGLGSSPSELLDIGGTLSFVANDLIHGKELWTSDGTAAGTTQLMDINPGPAGSNPGELTTVGSNLFFYADDGVSGEELWISDGTSAGTQLVSDVVIGSEGTHPRHLTSAANQLFFNGFNASGDIQLLASDGTSSGTSVVTPLPNELVPTSQPRDFVAADGVVYFIANDGKHGDELWRTDGTEAGTSLVKDIQPGYDFDTPFGLTAVGSSVYFIVDDGINGYQPWISDGSELGTFALADGIDISQQPLEFNGSVFFATYFDEIWVTDGTIAGTAQSEITGAFDRVATNGQQLFLRAPDGTISVSDGTLAGTSAVVDPNGLAPEVDFASQTFPTNSAGEAFFNGKTDDHGFELWKTDGTIAGTALVKDINLGTANSGPHELMILDDVLYFLASDGVNGVDLWRSDGTETGTYIAIDSAFPDRPTDIDQLTTVGDLLYFTANSNRELWVTDGSSAGTLRIRDYDPNYGELTDLVGIEDTLYFRPTKTGATELWASDGSVAGTVLVADIIPTGPLGYSNPYSYFDLQLTPNKSALFFVATNGPQGDEPWIATTAPNTAPIADAGGPYTVSSPGGSVTLDASASFDPDLDEALSYFWDVNGDGEYGDVAGETVTLNWATLNALGFSELNPSVQVSVRVSDGIGGATNSAPVSLDLVIPPNAVIAGPTDAVTFESLTYTLSTIGGDGGPNSYQIDWDGDGTFDETVPSTAGDVQLTHTFTQADVFNVGVLSSDASETGPLAILPVTVIPAVADIGGPYSGNEGSAIPLSASGSTGSLFEWDLDNDGQFDDAVGENISFPASDDGVFPIGLRVNGPGGPTATTTVTFVSVAPTATISGPTDLYRGETVTFTLDATDPSAVDQAGLFTFEIDWDGNGTVDETVANVPTGTTLLHAFTATTTNPIQVRATDHDGSIGSFSQTPITVSPHVLRANEHGTTDLIWGGTPGLDAVYIFGVGPSLRLFVQYENLQPVNRVTSFGAAVTGDIILYGYGFSDVLIGEFALSNVIEAHGGDGDDVIVGGFLGDRLYGDAGNDVILGGAQTSDGDDLLFGGEGRDTLFGHYGSDTLDGGGGEDLLISDRFNFGNTPQAVIKIGEEWKSARPFAERVSNILGLTSTGVSGIEFLSPGATIIDDGVEDTLIGGLGIADLDWFFYDFAQDILGDTSEESEEQTDSDP